MTYDPKQDPNLTAYALGELEGDEATAVETRIAENPEAAAYVASVRETADVLTGTLANESSDAGLTDGNRAAIEAAIAASSGASGSPDASAGEDGAEPEGGVIRATDDVAPRNLAFPAWGMALAAMLAIAITVFFAITNMDAPMASETAATSSKDASDADNVVAMTERPQAGTAANSVLVEESNFAAPDQPRQQRKQVASRDRATGALRERVLADSPVPSPDAAKPYGGKSLTGNKPADGALSQPTAPAPVVRSRPSKSAPTPTEPALIGLNGSPADPGVNTLAPSAPSTPKAAPAAKAPARSGAVVEAKRREMRKLASNELAKAKSNNRFKTEKQAIATDALQLVKEAEGGDADGDLRRDKGGFDREGYDAIVHNPYKMVVDEPLSTFSIDVDTGAYTNIRRMLARENRLPPAGAVRIEEMINYFPYYYEEPQGEDPFAANVEVAAAPWNTRHRLVRIGLQGKDVMDERPQANLVFLVDVSGSMRPANKLGYVKQSLEMLTRELDGDDRIAIAVYAGAAGLVLDSTPVAEKDKILASLDRLRSGGSTNGGAGIQLAYKVAQDNFIKGGINRVILCSDGDFNVGISDRASLIKLIEQKRETGVFLTTLGFGTGNLRDSQMEQIANKGNGAYNYIDSMKEARKVLVDELGGTLVTIAKDVKIQIEFNPAQVAAYRLIGYENRLLAKEDFNDDTKDAGEIGSGHTVTALYEVVPAGMEVEGAPKPGKVDELVFQPAAKPQNPAEAAGNVPAEHRDKLMLLKLRFKQPDGDTSVLRTFPVTDSDKKYDEASQDYKFAAAVAQFGMLLRQSPYKGASNYDAVLELAGEAIGEDKGGYRAEFLDLVRKAKSLDKR